MDAMSALRGPENLCYDLMDYPDEVEAALKRIRATYQPFLNEVYERGNMTRRGSVGWIPTYAQGRFATVQCDFSCLMSPEQGKRYVIPSIEEEVEALDHASYHYDGKEALVHLDNVLGIQGIGVIQWGSGRRTAQDAGMDGAAAQDTGRRERAVAVRLDGGGDQEALQGIEAGKAGVLGGCGFGG